MELEHVYGRLDEIVTMLERIAVALERLDDRGADRLEVAAERVADALEYVLVDGAVSIKEWHE